METKFETIENNNDSNSLIDECLLDKLITLIEND